jgi:hypothetical protein
MLHCFIPTGHCLYFVNSLTDSLLLGMVYMVSLHASLVHHHWAWFVLFHVMFHWFIITWHGLYCLTSCFTGSSLLGVVSLFEYTPLWFFLTGHDLHCFTSCFRGSFFFGMICTVSLPSLVHHYWAWFVLFHFMLHWFIITGHGLYCLTTSFTGSSLLGMVCIFSLQSSLILHY